MLAIGVSVACSGAPTTEACGVAGREQTCPCESDAIGIQTCQLDGTWEACTCYPLPGGAPAAGRNSAGAAGIAGSSGAAGAAAGRGASGIAGLVGFFAGRGGAGRRP